MSAEESKRAKVLRQVRVMLDIADRETTPAGEAANARARAEQLMRDYQIHEEETLAQDPQAILPEWREVNVSELGSAFQQEYVNLFHYIALHVGARARYGCTRSGVTATVCGYGFDLDVLDLMFTGARVVFSEHLEPKVDPALSDQVNAYRLRRSGIARNRVAHMLWGASMDSDGAPAHGKVAKLYKAECEARGETPALSGRGIPAETYRAAYAKSFVDRMWSRLAEARRATDRASTGVQLHGRVERVNEEFYTRYPEHRPVPATAASAARTCEACDRSKHASGKCPAHRVRPLTKAEMARYERANYSPAALLGRGAGRTAADQVKVDGSEPIRRIDDRTTGERETTRAVQGVLGK